MLQSQTISTTELLEFLKSLVDERGFATKTFRDWEEESFGVTSIFLKDNEKIKYCFRVCTLGETVMACVKGSENELVVNKNTLWVTFEEFKKLVEGS